MYSSNVEFLLGRLTRLERTAVRNIESARAPKNPRQLFEELQRKETILFVLVETNSKLKLFIGRDSSIVIRFMRYEFN